ncbi:MAG: hypothetical protein ABFS03_03335 [Chloroflexota bacterium]
MISIVVVFYIFIGFFALIGGLRGWAKELLVLFSVVLTLFMVLVLELYGGNTIQPFIVLDRTYQTALVPSDVDTFIIHPDDLVPFNSLPDEVGNLFRNQFWLRTVMLGIFVFFGFQTPALARLAGVVRREKIQDSLLGFLIGGFNGYLIVGTVWSYMHSAHYPFEPYIIAPDAADQLFETAAKIIDWLPPVWLGTVPGIYIAIGLAFLFVLAVLI